ncbi:MAG: hypothetical protein M9886_09555 [Candidatus Nanopelagicales bacterium]|nr:hypothetical protein [Candidatus Nanopelagicales bacterium]
MDERMTDYPPAVTAGDDLESGSEVVRVKGVKGRRRMFALDHWIGVDECTAIGFAVVEGLPIAVGIVHYAPITTTAVREWKVGEMIRPEPWMPRFDDRQPPTPDSLRNRWRNVGGTAKRAATGMASGSLTLGGSVNSAGVVTADAPLARREGQDPDEFYAEVARYYRAFAATTGGKPTTSIAKIAGVHRNTAAQWVHQARKRGHLEPADKAE